MLGQTTDKPRPLPGLDAEAMPLLSLGLGLTGLALGLRPRLAPVPLALTALTALLYRNPQRHTPDEPGMLFAPADGMIIGVDELYEHRFLHTDSLRIATLVSPLDVPVNRSPANGVVRYVEHIRAGYHSVRSASAAHTNTRTYIGIEAEWGPLLVVQIAGPLARHIDSRVHPGDSLSAGERIGTMRLGSRIDLMIQRDSMQPLIQQRQRLCAGETRIGQVVPL
jgi:phosphatidylserine decarboxylase